MSWLYLRKWIQQSKRIKQILILFAKQLVSCLVTYTWSLFWKMLSERIPCISTHAHVGFLFVATLEVHTLSTWRSCWIWTRVSTISNDMITLIRTFLIVLQVPRIPPLNIVNLSPCAINNFVAHVTGLHSSWHLHSPIFHLASRTSNVVLERVQESTNWTTNVVTGTTYFYGCAWICWIDRLLVQAFSKRRPLAARLSKLQKEITKSSSRSPSPTPTAFKTYFLPVRASVGPFDHVAEETEAREQSVASTRTRRDKHRWHGFEISAAPAVLGSASSCLHARRGDSWRSLRPTKAAGLHDANAKRLENLLTRENARGIREESRSRLWKYSWSPDEDQTAGCGRARIGMARETLAIASNLFIRRRIRATSDLIRILKLWKASVSLESS